MTNKCRTRSPHLNTGNCLSAALVCVCVCVGALTRLLYGFFSQETLHGGETILVPSVSFSPGVACEALIQQSAAGALLSALQELLNSSSTLPLVSRRSRHPAHNVSASSSSQIWGHALHTALKPRPLVSYLCFVTYSYLLERLLEASLWPWILDFLILLYHICNDCMRKYHLPGRKPPQSFL